MYLLFSLFLILFKPVDLKIPCDPPSFEFVDSPRSVGIAGEYTFTVGNNEELGCAINASYDWTLYRIVEGEWIQLPPDMSVLEHPGISKMKSNTVRMDAFGQEEVNSPKEFVMRVELIPEPTHIPIAITWNFTLTVEPPKSPQVIGISGGEDRSHFMDGTPLWLNVTGPDRIFAEALSTVWECFPPFLGPPPPNDMKWAIMEPYLEEDKTHECTVTVELPLDKKESASQKIHITRFSKMPKLALKCLKNCENEEAMVTNETMIDVFCNENCIRRHPTWEVKPYDPAYSNIPAKTIVKYQHYRMTIKANVFPPNSIIDFTVFWGDATATYTIRFGQPKFNFSIKCTGRKGRECNFDSTKEILLEVDCHTRCKPLDCVWEWLPPGLYEPKYAKGAKQYFKNCAMTFPPNNFEPGTNVSVRLRSGRTTVEYEFTTKPLGEEKTLTIKCTDCTPQDPRLPLQLEVSCEDTSPEDKCGDWVVAQYQIDRTPKGFHWYNHTSNNNKTLEIPENTFEDGETVKFEVFGPNGKGELEVEFKLAEAELILKCMENCGAANAENPNPEDANPETDNPDNATPDTVNPNSHRQVKLEVSCSGMCAYGVYEWRLDPEIPYLNLTAYQIRKNGSFLIIPENAYKEGQTVTVVVTKDKLTANLTLEFAAESPEIEVECMHNCMKPTNTMLDTVLEVRCVKDCDDFVPSWSIDPEVKAWYSHYELSNNNRTLTVKAGTYQDQEEVIFKAHGKNESEGNYTAVYGLLNPPPVVTLMCLKNCNNSWTMNETVLGIKCLLNCRNITYIWSIDPDQKHIKWERDFRLSEDNKTLTILPFVYDDGEEIDFTVKVIPEISPEITATVKIIFEELIPELVLTCSPIKCNSTVNRMESFSVTVECKKNCVNEPYRWSIEPPDAWKWNSTVRGIDNTTLTVTPESVKDGTHVTVTVTGGKTVDATANAYFIFENPKPELVIVCDKNCDFSDPHNEVILHVECTHLCAYTDTYKWVRKPYSKIKAVMGPKEQTMTILKESYKHGDIINVTVSSGGGNYTYTLKFLDPLPDLRIVCLRNCEYNPKLKTTFQVHCFNNCRKAKEMKYEWIANPSPNTTEIKNRVNTLITFQNNSYESYDKLNLTVTSGEAYDRIFVVFMTPTPEIKLKCITCDGHGRANPKTSTYFEATCEHNCEFLEYVWTLNPSPAFQSQYDTIFNNDKSNMTIKPNLYINNTHIRVNVSSGAANTSMDVYFFEPRPVFAILCVDNCGFPLPFEPLVVNVTCFENCMSLDKYSWSVSPPSDKKLEYGKDKITMTIPKDSYKDYNSVLITVKNGQAKAEAMFTYTMPPPVLKLSCKPSCENADPHKDLVIKVECTEFCDNPTYIWAIRPTLPDFIWALNVTEGDDNSTITIVADTFIDKSVTYAIVVSSKSAYAMTAITYVAKQPVITIKCVENCPEHCFSHCDFDIVYNTTLATKCEKNCYDVKINCTFTPPPYIPSQVIQDESNKNRWKILSDAYDNAQTVTVTCRAKESVVTLHMKWKQMLMYTQCGMYPKTGISGKTRHTIDCKFLQHDTMFRVYSAVPGFNGYGVLLWYGNHPIIQNILLPPGENLKGVRVVVGYDWRWIYDLYLATNESSYIQNGQCDVLKYWILGNKPENFPNLLQSRDYQQAIQLATLLDTYLEGCPPLMEIHYRRHLLEGILSKQEKIEPLQVLSFMAKVAFKTDANYVHPLNTYHMLMEGTRKSMQRLVYEAHLFLDEGSLKKMVYDTLQITDKIIEGTRNNQELFDPSSDSVGATSAKRHLKYITKDVVLTIDVILDIHKRWDETSHGILLQNSFLKPPEEETIFEINPQSFVVVLQEDSKYPRTNSLSAYNNVNLKLAVFPKNLFWWDKQVSSVVGEVFYFGITADEVKVKEADITIYAKYEAVKSEKIERTFKSGEELIVYEFNVPINSTLMLEIAAESINASISQWIPTLESITNKGQFVNGTETLYYYANSSKLFVGIAGSKKFTMEFASYQCFTWHGDEWTWDTNNCRLVEPQQVQHKNDHIACHCKSLSMFTANKTIPEYKEFDFSVKPIQASLKQFMYNSVITAMAVIIIAVAMGLAYVRDKQLKQRIKFNVLEDNNPNDTELYLISVQTGIWKGSGTTARVAIQIKGTNGKSEVHLLNPYDKTLLRRNAADCFIMYTRKDLGKIRKITLWHDSHGDEPHWFCSSVVVRNVKRRKRSTFVVNKWLSLVYGDGNTKGIFYAKKKTAIAPYSAQLDETIRNNHNYFGYLTDRVTDSSTMENVAITTASILVTSVTLLFLTPEDGYNEIWNMLPWTFAAGVAGVLTSLVLNFLFRESQKKILKGK